MSADPKTSKLQTAKRGTHCVQRRALRIVTSGADRQMNHRADFKHCPSCDQAMENEAWDKAAVTLVIEPACYKAGCVSIISECPKCFELSWIHSRMAGFEWDDAWPDEWKAAVRKREAAVKLEALRQWGAGICHNCKHLTEGNVEYHAWRHCIKGSGPAEKACDKYAALNSPNNPSTQTR